MKQYIKSGFRRNPKKVRTEVDFDSYGVPRWLNATKVLRESTAQTLFMIASHVHSEGGVPGAVQLASYDWLKVTPKAAINRLTRLKNNDFLIQDKRGEWILHPRLIHKPETAKLLLMLYGECTGAKSMRCSMEKLTKLTNGDGISDVDKLINIAHAAGFISVHKNGRQTFLTVRDSLRCLRGYLKLVAS